MGGELLTVEDLFPERLKIEPALTVFCLDGRIFEDPNNLQGVSPGLSFKWDGQTLERFASSERLKRALSDFRKEHGSGVGIMERSDVSFLYSPSSLANESIVRALAAGVSVVFAHSLNALNKRQDEAEKLSRALQEDIDLADGKFGLLELAKFLDLKTGLDFGLLHIASSPTSPLGRAITVAAASAAKTTLAKLAHRLGLPDNSFVLEEEGTEEPFPIVSLPQNRIAELVVNAALWGKSLASDCSIGDKERLLVIPIVRPLEPRSEASESVELAATDLLFAFVPQLESALFQAVLLCVETFSDYRFGKRRFNLLAGLQVDDGTKWGGINEPLSALLREILYTTSAHHVSLRVYDPNSRALKLVSNASGAMQELSPIVIEERLRIKQNSHCNLAVFTFLNAGSCFAYTYLRRMSPPIEQTIHGKTKLFYRTYVPPEYKNKGLERPLAPQKITRSEICFPLMKGDLAFGTLNLEAPYPGAFDNDIEYLTLVKTGIEFLYGGLDQRIDAQWLIANAARSDAIHELWQYQETETFFTKEQNNVLRTIFPSRNDNELAGTASLSSLKHRTLSWVGHRYGADQTLCTAVRGMIKFDHLGEVTVGKYFLDATFVIVKNLVQNAVKHGEPSEDLLIFDDRAWFGARSIPCLRIHYRTDKTPPNGVTESLGKAPIRELVGDELRVGYGMYNAGLLSRLLGGNIYVTHKDNLLGMIVETHLPLGGTK